MLVNEQTAVSSPKILLVPYQRHHVPTYHEWLQDKELQEATASEPLTLDEEYAMQESWRRDNNKLTFILCLPLDSPTASSIKSGTADAPSRMLGDVNLFLVDDDEQDTPESQDTPKYVIGELEVMIARRDLVRRGYGRAAVQTFVEYIKQNLDAILHEYTGGKEALLSYLRVKIGATNAASIALFQNFGFRAINPEPNVFGEIEFRRNVEHMYDHCEGYRTLTYDDRQTTNGA